MYIIHIPSDIPPLGVLNHLETKWVLCSCVQLQCGGMSIPSNQEKKVGFRLGQVIALHLAPINKKKNNYTYSVYMMNVDLDIRKI